MNTMPAIGTQVTYRDGARACTGTVVAHYPKYADGYNDHAGIRVDAIPTWWPYPDTDRVAPAISTLKRRTTINP